MQIVALSFLGFAVLVVAIVLAPKRHNTMPVSERAVDRLLRLAAWLEHVAIAWDAAILRYRMERRMLSIQMDSTRERERRAKTVECPHCVRGQKKYTTEPCEFCAG